MDVIAFIGPSGTGKSHRALVVAHEHHASCIIDDGILIHNNRIVGGFSAKKEENRIKAVRRAIFQDKKQVESVRKALDEIQPERLMILGTSEKMIGKITKALGIPGPSYYIHIEDVATPKDIEKAQHARLKEGKHIIPVPTVELKPHFKGFLIDPIKSFWRRTRLSSKQDEGWEKSVIRPAFSYYGKLVFEDAVIQALIRNSIEKSPGVTDVRSMDIKKSKEVTNGLILQIDVTVMLGFVVKEIMDTLQKTIRQEIEYITGMSIERLAIKVGGTIEPSKVKYKHKE